MDSIAKRLVLASASPRRKELLAKLAASFEIVVSDVSEIEPPACHWSEAARLNAVAKAKAVSDAMAEALALGADTVIELDGEILGKPRSLEDAKAMLRKMSGRVHTVATGVCLTAKKAGILSQFTDRTLVRFKELNEETISLYLSKVNVLDKAGAYAIQEHGGLIIEGIEGDMDNVIGLPATRVAEAIAGLKCGALLKEGFCKNA